MIKSGTRVSNPKGTGGYEFTKDVNLGEIMEADHIKPYGKQRKPKRGDPVPKWFMDWLSTARFEPEPETPTDYAWSEHVIPVIYKRDLGDRVYSIEDDENLYHVQLATLSDGEYFIRNILTTRWLWIARAYVRLHGWMS